ncbi:MAG: GIY-YIG nuclease family protein [Bacteroidota bacterium]|nr:GIY-YIG nuclease family protein [Bacteroidota bacterium]
MKYFVYIIYSASLDKFYIGFTSNKVSIRLKKHNANHKGFTGKKADWVLKYAEEFTTKVQAMERERNIKAWKSRIKIQKLISAE